MKTSSLGETRNLIVAAEVIKKTTLATDGLIHSPCKPASQYRSERNEKRKMPRCGIRISFISMPFTRSLCSNAWSWKRNAASLAWNWGDWKGWSRFGFISCLNFSIWTFFFNFIQQFGHLRRRNWACADADVIIEICTSQLRQRLQNVFADKFDLVPTEVNETKLTRKFEQIAADAFNLVVVEVKLLQVFKWLQICLLDWF